MTDSVSVQGIDIHIQGRRDANAETIVMVHGWPDTYRLWDGQVAVLKDHYRCVRFTLPGFDPAKERRAYNLEELSDFLKAVIAKVSPNHKVILLLHDWGCFFGYQFYLRNPELVSKIIGVDVGDSISLRAVQTLKQQLMVRGYQYWLATCWKIGGNTGDRLARTMARWLKCPQEEADIHACMGYGYYMMWFGGEQAYRRNVRSFFPDCPMLYVYGRRKPMQFQAPEWLEKLAAREGNHVEEFNAGHWVMLDKPQEFNRLMLEWLAE